ncbi:MAG: hypothetical protein N3A01_04525 [Bacteroidales bacterium]|nr:hypothetical protein [Bacteroidales bacterium]
MYNIFSKYFFISFILFFQYVSLLKSQENIFSKNIKIKEWYNQTIDADDFRSDILNSLILFYINKYREKERLDTLQINPILASCAEDHSRYMAEIQTTTLEGEGKKKTTKDRVIYFGGSGIADEIVLKNNISSPNEVYTYGKLAEDIGFKLVTDNKLNIYLQSPRYIFIGIGSSLDVAKKKVYISILFANYSLYNDGYKLKNNLKIPYTTKTYGILPYDNKECKICSKYRNIENLHKCLYVKDKKIFFKHNNIKLLKSILKTPEDAIAVDIVQKSQYPCKGPNIVDLRNINKGILLKPVNFDYLVNNNTIIDPKEKKIKIDTQIGTIPEGIDENYELNLLIIKNNHLCMTITPSYEEEANIEFSKELTLLADTVIIGEEYTPIAEKSTIEFKVPFEKGKYEYKIHDIKPILDKLNEPDYTINKLQIEAFSSLEGGEDINKELQQKRAESIVQALKEIQKSKFHIKIITSENIEDFKRDIKNTQWAFLADKPIEEIKKYIQENKLQEKLEPILKNHRYARVTMDITYKLDETTEEKYVISRFNKNVKEENYSTALRIQKYIFKKIVKGVFSENAVYNQEIPEKPETAGLLMNKLWLEKYIKKEDINEKICKKIEQLYKLKPSNEYIKYNYCYCRMMFENLTNEQNISSLQKDVSSLYNTSLRSKTVDLLNLELQFKIIAALDTTNFMSPLILASLDTIKSILKLTKPTWQNSLKLAQIFISQKDFETAARLLEPWLTTPNVFDELIFTYLAICTHITYKFSSPKFVYAIKRAIAMDKERLCYLYKRKKISFQSFENPQVKEIICNECGE